MFERFTDRARRVVVLAQEEARVLNHNYIGTEHILLGLLSEGDGVGAKVLGSVGISLDAARSGVESIIGRGPGAPVGHVPFTPRAKKVLELSWREARQLGHNFIGTEHLLLGLIREGEGVAAQVLVELGADMRRTRQLVIAYLEQTPTGGDERVLSGLWHLGRYSFTERGWRVLELAQEAAGGLGHEGIEPSHFAVAIVTIDDPAVEQILSSWGVDLAMVRARIEELAARGEASGGGDVETEGGGEPPPT
jgi:ATP-dependent Clp protease ATP-binding subunit ClpA